MSINKLIFLLLFLSNLCFFNTYGDNTTSISPVIKYLKSIADQHNKTPFSPIPIIAIGGCPGVGKTYFAEELIAALHHHKINCIRLALDHFNLSKTERKKIGTEWDLRHLKVKSLHACLLSIYFGEKFINKPKCNQLTGDTHSELLGYVPLNG